MTDNNNYGNYILGTPKSIVNNQILYIMVEMGEALSLSVTRFGWIHKIRITKSL